LDLQFAIAFPVVVGEQIAGVLEFLSAEPLQPDGQLQEAMASVGMHLGRIIERADFEEHLLTIAEEIQRGIAQDLHDDFGQELTGLGLKAETLAEMLAGLSDPVGKLAADVAATVERIRYKVRRFSRGMLPPEMEQGLLAAALEQLAAATTAGSRITCTFAGTNPYRSFDSRVATQLFRIAQESVANAARHSGAQRIRIELNHGRGGTELRVEDDGTGLPAAAVDASGMGLRTMRYRAELIGAQLHVGPGPKGGTLVVCQWTASDSQPETIVGSEA
jgi:signal transduction histidine kinase